ncbi:DUF2059 domain-containing protein [Nitratireductor mangrovi]|uniref:DUF2059 domain-containing protein n=1 Tax=Nitratireductor mangrovi TaxID=2599600 RepID=A0A5B8L339_9HYPH|nr:DUF2059 domain-containing protein [Nitratireductor mangrovi]QDZ01958.1 DUF2059 domain-containing protein [Nitratireductor mangrovi]
MTIHHKARRAAAAIVAVVAIGLTLPASAQDVSESHLQAARAAIGSLNATEEFDDILPAAAQALKAELIQKDPNLQGLIIEVVDQQALKLAPRRGDLEREAALAYARTFTEDELNGIAQFYTSAPGIAFKTKSPLVTRDLLQAADIWQKGLARDLAVAVNEEMKKRAGGGEAASD